MPIAAILSFFSAVTVHAAQSTRVDYTYSQVVLNTDGSVTIQGLQAHDPAGATYGVAIAAIHTGPYKRPEGKYEYSVGAYAICKQVTGLPQPFIEHAHMTAFQRYAVLSSDGRFLRLTEDAFAYRENAYTSDELGCRALARK